MIDNHIDIKKIVLFCNYSSRQINLYLQDAGLTLNLNKNRLNRFFNPIGIALFFILFISIGSLFSQSKATISGKIVDEKGMPLELVNIAIKGLPGGVTTNKSGEYSIQIPANKKIDIVFSYIGLKNRTKQFQLIPQQSIYVVDTLSTENKVLDVFTVEDSYVNQAGLAKIESKNAGLIPSVSGTVESMIKSAGMGVTSNNELSSQYNVRGGNFDENLIYVNDIEIYRPFLIRSGQQEGLSFVNSDMVESIRFSSGGFESKFGDKLSSVLDITYKKPKRIGGIAWGSLLGGSLFTEGLTTNKKLTYLLGVRYKSTAYILKSMETKGDYKPTFFDIQTLITYTFSDKFDVSFLGNFAKNTYQLVPQNRETTFGTVKQAIRLKIYFDGQEVDQYTTLTGAFTATYKPTKKTVLKFIASAFNAQEKETYDIQGQYWLDDIETDMGSDNFGDVTFNRGVGTYLDHARNYLNSTIVNLEHRGETKKSNHKITWGAKYQHELFVDKLNEWHTNDSAGYILPYPTASDSTIGVGIPLNDSLRQFNLTARYYSNNRLESDRLSAFVQDLIKINIDSSQLYITAGVRASYWTVNKEMIVSPRFTVAFVPKNHDNITYRFSSGLYYQPPQYKEIRDIYGTVHSDVLAQRAVHFVLGTDYSFKKLNRPFKLSAELYYKYLDRVIPYIVDNVRIRYSAKNEATAYAAGVDVKLSGEFVPGTDSWISVSLMQTEQNIETDSYYDASTNQMIDPGYFPRPSDQRINVNLFFQDYLPMNPTYKMHLNLVFGTGLPFGAPNAPLYKHTRRMTPYRRVDIGFSKQLFTEAGLADRHGFWKQIRSSWLSLEVFNLLQISNTISYIWVTDIFNEQYAVPNYLTPRQINLKLMVEF